jgi:hypothetical protein
MSARAVVRIHFLPFFCKALKIDKKLKAKKLEKNTTMQKYLEDIDEEIATATSLLSSSPDTQNTRCSIESTSSSSSSLYSNPPHSNSNISYSPLRLSKPSTKTTKKCVIIPCTLLEFSSSFPTTMLLNLNVKHLLSLEERGLGRERIVEIPPVEEIDSIEMDYLSSLNLGKKRLKID